MNESWIAHFVPLHSVEKCLCWLPANVFCCPSRWTAVSIIWCLHQFHNQFHNCLLWCRGVLIPPSSHKWQPLYYLPSGEQAFCKSAVRPPHKCLNCSEFYILSMYVRIAFKSSLCGLAKSSRETFVTVVLWGGKDFYSGYFYQIREQKTS